MSNKADKNKADFIKAIFNVKEYTKNLKKNATNFQDMSSSIQSQDQISSYVDPPFTAKTSNQFYQSNNQLTYSLTSLKETQFDLKDKKNKSKSKPNVQIVINSSYQVPYPKLKKSSHSQLEKYGEDASTNNKLYAFPTHSLVKIKHSTNNSFAMHQSLGMNNQQKPKNKNSNTYSNFNQKSDKSDLSADKNSFSKKAKQISTLKNTSKINTKHKNSEQFFYQNPQIVQSLLLKIQQLRNTIQLYECAMLEIKKQYLKLKDKDLQKIYLNHLIDTLKQQIQDQKNKNQILRKQIETKDRQCEIYDKIIIDSVQKLRTSYQSEFIKINKLAKQNEFLRSLLLIANPSVQKQQLIILEMGLNNNTQIQTINKQIQQNDNLLNSNNKNQRQVKSNIKEEENQEGSIKKPKFSINLQKLKQKINKSKKEG